MKPGERFVLGINYWPRTSAMAMWSQFDRGEIAEDFARIADLGLGVVRFFLDWEAFQPLPDTIDRTALSHLDTVLELAATSGLQTMPTFFCGHMSGVNWLPEWTLDRSTASGRFRTIAGGRDVPYGIGDFYTGALLEAQRLAVRTIGARARAHPAIFAWDLGNEFSNLREPRTPRDAAQWGSTLADDLLVVSNIRVTGGIHGEDITRDRQIRPSSICEPWSFATMHGYSVYSAFARDRRDPDVVPFLAAITRACARKPVLFSEFGNPTCPAGTIPALDRVALPGEASSSEVTVAVRTGAAPFACLTELEMSDYARAVLERLHRQGALGALWWCWADYAADLARRPPFDRAPHELHFGIVRNDGSQKPVAAALAAFAAAQRTIVAPPAAIVDEAVYFAGLPESLDTAYATYCAAGQPGS